MANSVYAIEQAQRAFKTAREHKELHKWQSDLRRIASLTRDAAILALLQNPKVSFGDKTKVLSERLGEINPGALKLLAELISEGRLSAIDEIADEFQRLLDNYHGIEGVEIAEVTTAIPLDDDDRLRIAQRLTSIIGKPVMLKDKVDSSLIGGIVIRVGDKLIDGSIRSKLGALKKTMGNITR